MLNDWRYQENIVATNFAAINICNTAKLNELNEYFRSYLEKIGLTHKHSLPRTAGFSILLWKVYNSADRQCQMYLAGVFPLNLTIQNIGIGLLMKKLQLIILQEPEFKRILGRMDYKQQGSDRNFKVKFPELSRFSKGFKTKFPEILVK